MKIGDRVCVINFRSTGIEIDICVIEELGGHFMNFIKKIKREQLLLLNEGSDLFFQQIIYQILLETMNDSIVDFENKYLIISQEDAKTLQKMKRRFQNRLCEICEKAKSCLLDDHQSDYTIYWTTELSNCFCTDIENDSSILNPTVKFTLNDLYQHSEEMIVHSLQNALQMTLNKQIENNEQQTQEKLKIDHVIVLGELYEYQPITKLITNQFNNQRIHYFKTDKFSEILCQIAETIVTQPNTDVEIISSF